MRRKLASYSLNERHEHGAAKASGFALILGITAADIDHVEAEICSAILETPIRATRGNPPYGFNCVVDVQVRGIGWKSGQKANVRTIWLLTGADSRPCLISAFPKP